LFNFNCINNLTTFFDFPLAATVICAFCYNYVELAIYAGVFGAMIGAYVGLTSVILVDLLGLDRLTNAFGLLLLFQGIASLVGPPIAGKKVGTVNFLRAQIMVRLCLCGLIINNIEERWLTTEIAGLKSRVGFQIFRHFFA
jgi:hypothetical protein